MSNEDAIKVEGLSKKFCRSLRRSMAYGTIDLAMSMLGRAVDQTKLRKGEFWALENISFELKKGEVLGIIGVNGSGKSTLLRMLTGIFPPDVGTISISGKVGALIAVGSGFHPHFTGRENIYLNATILGLTRREIDLVFQDIVAFADIGDFLESPVSTYSSGMKVRLGFSVAIHCVPEILLVDEVLAVGDMAFRKKCLDKMEQIKHRTSIVFISHNTYQVQRICDRVILMDKGKVISIGKPDEIISEYYNLSNTREIANSGGEEVVIHQSAGQIEDISFAIDKELEYGQDIEIKVSLNSIEDFIEPVMGIALMTSDGIDIASLKNKEQEVTSSVSIRKGHNNLNLLIKSPNILPGNYKLRFNFKAANNAPMIDGTGPSFTIRSKKSLNSYDGIIKLDGYWESND